MLAVTSRIGLCLECEHNETREYSTFIQVTKVFARLVRRVATPRSSPHQCPAPKHALSSAAIQCTGSTFRARSSVESLTNVKLPLVHAGSIHKKPLSAAFCVGSVDEWL